MGNQMQGPFAGFPARYRPSEGDPAEQSPVLQQTPSLQVQIAWKQMSDRCGRRQARLLSLPGVALVTFKHKPHLQRL